MTVTLTAALATPPAALDAFVTALVIFAPASAAGVIAPADLAAPDAAEPAAACILLSGAPVDLATPAAAELTAACILLGATLADLTASCDCLSDAIDCGVPGPFAGAEALAAFAGAVDIGACP